MTERAISLGLQIATVRREIAMRRRVYPRLVGQRKMRQAEADMGVQHMQAVLTTLEWLERNETAIKAKVEAVEIAGGN